jgi:hypothetical protein
MKSIIIFWDLTPCSLVKLTNISEVCTIPIFRIEEEAKHAICKNLLLVSCLLFDPEDGGSTFVRNFGVLIPDYTALHLRR